jgi:RNA polymerase sigma-70 factor, ECF subfamily
MILKLPGGKTEERSDSELVERFTLSGDLQVLGALYSRYMPLVYGVCLKYFRDRDESMDAVMQIFEKLVADIPKQKIENFRNWLHIVSKNYCLMQLRSRRSVAEKHNEWLLEPGNIMEINPALHPIDDDQPDMEKALADCIAKLKEEQKECITRFYYNNKCYNEIAEELGIDEKKVKSYLQNGKRNLKLCIEEKNERERK